MVGRDGWSGCVGREGKEGGRMAVWGACLRKKVPGKGVGGYRVRRGVAYREVRRGLWVLSMYLEHETQIVYCGVGVYRGRQPRRTGLPEMEGFRRLRIVVRGGEY